MEYIFNVEAHAEHTGWHWCYEVSEIGTFFEKKPVGYQAKKSKVILIMGISGAMRRGELTKMSIDDIKDEHSVLIVAVPDTKTGIKRTFTVTNPEFVRLYRKYAALVPCTHPELKKDYKLCSVAFET
jgi:integrase